MTALTPEARKVLSALSDEAEPLDGAARARIRAGLAAQVGLAVSAAGASSAAAAGGGLGGALVLTKVAVAAVVIALGGAVLVAVAPPSWRRAGTTAAGHDGAPAARATVSGPRPATPAPVTAAGEAPARRADPAAAPADAAPSRADVALPRRRAPTRRSPRGAAGAHAGAMATAAGAPAAHRLDRELDVLAAAGAALRARDPARALAALDAHAAEFPAGEMREEALAVRVLALCAAGRGGEARAVADRLLRAAPRSPQAARVRASCAFAARGAGGPPGP